MKIFDTHVHIDEYAKPEPGRLLKSMDAHGVDRTVLLSEEPFFFGKEGLTPEDFRAIGEWLAGTEKYFIQNYADSGDILEPGMAAFSKEELAELLAAIRPYIPGAALRGAD